MAQNSRYLLLVERGEYPNLASRVLSLCARQLSKDWETAFGYPVLIVESFVDPQFFFGHCYRAAGWEAAGATQGCRRHHRDFYQEDGTPKELWLRALHPKARKWLKAEGMPERFARHEDEAQYCPYKAKDFRSLWEHYTKVNDPRRANGRLYVLAGVLSICTLAVLCGCRGTRAIADFAEHLGQPQRRLLRCYWNRKTKKYDAPSEPTIRRILKEVSADEFDKEVMAWQAEHDPQPLRRLAVDGKTVKQARAADGRALHLVAAVSPDSGANAEILLEIVRGHWSIECNHHVRDRTYDEDRCQVRNPNSARILATLRSTARFLAKQNAHHPRNVYQSTTPGLNRFCDAYRNKTIGWIMKPKSFL